MRCSQAQRLLSSRRDVAVSVRHENALADHLVGCAACRRYEDALIQAVAELAAISSVSVRGGLAHNAISLWSTEAKAPQPRFHPMRIASFALAGAAALIVFGSVRRPHPPPRHSAPAVAIRSKHIAPDLPPLKAPSEAAPTFAAAAHNHQFSPVHTLRPLPGRTDHPQLSSAVPIDDMTVINSDVAATISRWNGMDLDRTQAQLDQLQQSVRGGDDFVKVSLPPIAGMGGGALRAAIRAYRQQVALVDVRLQHRITLAAKGVPLSDLCQQLSVETGIELRAGRSVADDKITVFCTERPLRDLMRQITRLFGFTWLRDGQDGAFRYQLEQDLRAQLLEEELRNRDRDAALVALDREMERYRKYLSLSPEEARRQIGKVPEEDVKLLSTLGGAGWAPVHLYFELSPQEQRTLREEPELRYGEMNAPDERPLPPELRDNVLGTLNDIRISTENGGFSLTSDPGAPGMTPAEFPGSRATLQLQLSHDQLDHYTLTGMSGVMAVSPTGSGGTNLGATLAVGISPTLANLNNAAANAKLENDPNMRRRVTVATKPSCFPRADYDHREPAPRATIADALEALHKATGQDIVADYYTRFYNARDLSTADMTLFDTLNRLANKMRLRWKQDVGWLAFRSAAYYYDRVKEVPHRLLARWAEAKRKNGMLTVSDLTEIAGLSDAQLDSLDMAEGAWAIYGLDEWSWVQNNNTRAHWRLLTDFTPQMLQELSDPKGVTLDEMTLAQQQRYVALVFGQQTRSAQPRLADLTGDSVRLQLPKPETLTRLPQGRYDPLDYGPRFIYTYRAPNAGIRTLIVGPHGMSTSG